MRTNIIHGDSLRELARLDNDSVDLICTDPPYGYSFMGKDWDKAVPSVDIWKECLRVLKPGAFAFVMSAPRSDVLSRMIVRLEDAGFRIDFTPIYWTYASGFPKAMNVGKMVDKRNNTPREVTGAATSGKTRNVLQAALHPESFGGDYEITKGTSPLEGSYGGFQPKPAVEVIIVAMKPLSEKTFVDQALKNGKGVTWLDDCRVSYRDAQDAQDAQDAFISRPGAIFNNARHSETRNQSVNLSGRFPANLLVNDNVLGDHSKFFSYPFLVVPKASKGEKNEGLDAFELKQSAGGGGGIGNYEDNVNSASGKYGSEKAPAKNFHPTVKPLKLMSYLITLGSRPGDTVLDPFVGSGTTALAAENLGRIGIGIEREEEYAQIARARLKNAKPIQLQIAAV